MGHTTGTMAKCEDWEESLMKPHWNRSFTNTNNMSSITGEMGIVGRSTEGSFLWQLIGGESSTPPNSTRELEAVTEKISRLGSVSHPQNLRNQFEVTSE